MTRDELVAGLVQVLHDVIHNRMGRNATAARLEAMAARVRGSGQLGLKVGDQKIVEDQTAEKDTSAEAVHRVFEYWRERTGKKRARLLVERATKIRAQLRRFTEAELKDAIDGALLSEFHVDGDYLGLETLLKNGPTIEKHIERKRGSGTPGGPESDRVAEIRQAMEAAREAGDTEQYNEWNRRLKHELEQGRRREATQRASTDT